MLEPICLTNCVTSTMDRHSATPALTWVQLPTAKSVTKNELPSKSCQQKLQAWHHLKGIGQEDLSCGDLKNTMLAHLVSCSFRLCWCRGEFQWCTNRGCLTHSKVNPLLTTFLAPRARFITVVVVNSSHNRSWQWMGSVTVNSSII